ncbi:carbohydrate kinase [Abortiporus biennis]|nr:carbohydrate kinase [Abortiporus biennis]
MAGDTDYTEPLEDHAKSTSNITFHDGPPILIIVMGVAGTGKSTLAEALNKELELSFIEGDNLHPQSNIDKMSAGQPLTDSDREPWLALIRTTAEHMIAEQESKFLSQSEDDNSLSKQLPRKRRRGVLITCSALKKYYRDILRGTYAPPGVPQHLEPSQPKSLPTYFVYIKEESLLRERIAKREGHYMKPQMVDSQLAALESPEGEPGVVVVPLADSTEEQVRKALEQLRKLVGGDL